MTIKGGKIKEGGSGKPKVGGLSSLLIFKAVKA